MKPKLPKPTDEAEPTPNERLIQRVQDEQDKAAGLPPPGKGMERVIGKRPGPPKPRLSEAKEAKVPLPAEGMVRHVDISLIMPPKEAVRLTMHDETVNRIATSIKEVGIIEPLVVRVTNDHFTLIAGHHRLEAAKKAGLTRVPVITYPGDPKDDYVMSLIENIHRSDLTAPEEALALKELRDGRKISIETIAKRLGLTPSWISNRIRLLELPRDLIMAMDEGKLDASKGLLILKLPEEKRLEVGKYAIEYNTSYTGLEQRIAEIMAAEQQIAAPEGVPPPSTIPERKTYKCYYCLQDRDINDRVFMTMCSDCAKRAPPKKGI